MLLILEQRRILITGQVQGVAFMLWVRNVANSLELAGSVRALPDGRCEVIIKGDRTLVKQFIVACKRGPAEATVEGIEHESAPLDTRLVGFVVHH
jgi:acylphosphatase